MYVLCTALGNRKKSFWTGHHNNDAMPFQGSESEIGNYDDLYVTTTLSQTKLSNPFKKFK